MSSSYRYLTSRCRDNPFINTIKGCTAASANFPQQIFTDS